MAGISRPARSERKLLVDLDLIGRRRAASACRYLNFGRTAGVSGPRISMLIKLGVVPLVFIRLYNLHSVGYLDLRSSETVSLPNQTVQDLHFDREGGSRAATWRKLGLDKK